MKIKNIKTKLKIAGLIAISALLPYLSSNLKAATHTLAKNSSEIEAVGIGETMDSTYAFSLKWTENSRIEHWGNYGKNILTTFETIFRLPASLDIPVSYRHHGLQAEFMATCLDLDMKYLICFR